MSKRGQTHLIRTAVCGNSIVKTLAKDLQKGVTARNLWNMRTFYLTYKNDQKLQPLVAKISWTKNVIIKERYP